MNGKRPTRDRLRLVIGSLPLRQVLSRASPRGFGARLCASALACKYTCIAGGEKRAVAALEASADLSIFPARGVCFHRRAGWLCPAAENLHLVNWATAGSVHALFPPFGQRVWIHLLTL